MREVLDLHVGKRVCRHKIILLKGVSMDRFEEKDRVVVPVSKFRKIVESDKTVWMVDHAFCPNGHSLMDNEHPIHGYPGIRLAFKLPDSEGEVVISALAGDLTKTTISGELEPGVRHDLSCPHCHVSLPVLMSCGCKRKGQLVVIGLTPKLNFNDAITLCDVAGCTNAAVVSSGEIIRHMRVPVNV